MIHGWYWNRAGQLVWDDPAMSSHDLASIHGFGSTWSVSLSGQWVPR